MLLTFPDLDNFRPRAFVYLCISQNKDLLVAKCSCYITMQQNFHKHKTFTGRATSKFRLKVFINIQSWINMQY